MMKKEKCYVACDYNKEMSSKVSAKKYTLPDERTMSIEKERIQCLEALFWLLLVGIDGLGK